MVAYRREFLPHPSPPGQRAGLELQVLTDAVCAGTSPVTQRRRVFFPPRSHGEGTSHHQPAPSQHSAPPLIRVPSHQRAPVDGHIHATSVKTLASSTHKILPKCALDGAPTFCGARRSAPIGWDYRGRNSPTEPPLRFCCFREADIEICEFAS